MKYDKGNIIKIYHNSLMYLHSRLYNVWKKEWVNNGDHQQFANTKQMLYHSNRWWVYYSTQPQVLPIHVQQIHPFVQPNSWHWIRWNCAIYTG